MRSTIDAGGRVVIPKSLRTELGLVAGDEVDIELDGWTIRIERRPGDAKVSAHGQFLVVEGAGANLTENDLRAMRLDAQR